MTKATLNFSNLTKESKKRVKEIIKDRRAYYKNYNNQFKRVTLRLEREEFKELEKLSKKAWLTNTSFIKEIFLNYKANEPVISQEIIDELKKLVFAIQWVANNINQIAKSNNLVSSLFNAKRAKDELVKINSLVKEFINKKYQ